MLEEPRLPFRTPPPPTPGNTEPWPDHKRIQSGTSALGRVAQPRGGCGTGARGARHKWSGSLAQVVDVQRIDAGGHRLVRRTSLWSLGRAHRLMRGSTRPLVSAGPAHPRVPPGVLLVPRIPEGGPVAGRRRAELRRVHAAQRIGRCRGAGDRVPGHPLHRRPLRQRGPVHRQRDWQPRRRRVRAHQSAVGGLCPCPCRSLMFLLCPAIARSAKTSGRAFRICLFLGKRVSPFCFFAHRPCEVLYMPPAPVHPIPHA